MENNKISNAVNHFKTITNHKILVMKYCFKVGLYKQGLLHDLSKYSWVEFSAGIKYFRGNISPNAAQKMEEGCSEAWLHHKGRNKHHFEYWIDHVKREKNLLTKLSAQNWNMRQEKKFCTLILDLFFLDLS